MRGNQEQANGAKLELLPVQGSVSMVAGAGGNITVQAGKDGILLVDTGEAGMTDKVLEVVRPLSKGQIVYIINTNDRSDHVGGNEYLAKTGRPLAINRASQATVMIVAFNRVLDRISAPTRQTAAMPEKAWPNDTYSVPQKNLFFNGEPIQVFHQPGTTDGNSIVLFQHFDVISAGDIFDPGGYPIIDLKSGGSFQGVLDGLYRIKQMAVPADHQEGGTSAPLAECASQMVWIFDRALGRNTLVYTTDHLEEGYLTRTGVPRSAKSTVTTRIHRYGNYLNVTLIIDDPAYLTQPYIREYSWVYAPDQVIAPFPCEIIPDGTILPAGSVPNFLPGKNDILYNFATEYGIPPEAALGGAETLSPDYIKKLKTMKVAPHITTEHFKRAG